MPRASLTVEESENGEKVNDQNGEGAQSEEEEEYEIEAILDAKKGMFPEGRLGYWVKWKGYSEDENSWVDEQDAGNAASLIEQFWAKRKAKSRKSTEPKGRPRKSESVKADSKKRSRKCADADDMDVEEAAPPKKTQRKGADRTRSESVEVTEELLMIDDNEKPIGEMSNFKEYKDLASWEHLVKHVDTVEQDHEINDLLVYFTLSDGTRVREPATSCKQKFPQKLLSFYEGNLRWRSVQPDDDVEKL